MLSVIDQKWREHLYEMDYLREGINLRAMGQRDPLAEWQREGFDMFEAMMEGTKDDFVRYIFRLEVVADDAPASGAQPAVLRGRRSGAGLGWLRGRRARRPDRGARRGRAGPRRRRGADGARAQGEDPGTQRALLLRERQEVQALPRQVNRRPVRDFSDDLAELTKRVQDAHAYLHIDEARDRLVELEVEASKPDLWDDPDAARRVTTEMSGVRDDVELLDGLESRVDDVDDALPARARGSRRLRRGRGRSGDRSAAR